MQRKRWNEVVGDGIGIANQDIDEILEEAAHNSWNKHYGSHENYADYEITFINGVLRVCKTDGENGKKIVPFEFSSAFTADLQMSIKDSIQNFQKQKEYDYFSDKIDQIVTCNYNTRGDRGIVANIRDKDAIRLTGEKVIGRAMIDRISSSEMRDLRASDFSGKEFYGLLYRVKRTNNGVQLYVDRLSDRFVIELLKTVDIIPEIQKQMVIIRSVARDYGMCYILVQGVGVRALSACVGFKAERRIRVSEALGGDKVYFIEWTPSISELLSRMFAKQEVQPKDIIIEENSCYIITNNKGEVIGRNASRIKLCRKLLAKFYLDDNLELVETETARPMFRMKLSAVTRDEYSKIAIANIQTLADDILKDSDLETYKEELISVLVGYKGNIEVLMSDALLSANLRDIVMRYFENNVKPALLKEYVEQGGDAAFFMNIPGVNSSVYFDLLILYDIKNSEDRNKITSEEMARRFHLPTEVCEELLQS